MQHVLQGYSRDIHIIRVCTEPFRGDVLKPEFLCKFAFDTDKLGHRSHAFSEASFYNSLFKKNIKADRIIRRAVEDITIG